MIWGALLLLAIGPATAGAQLLYPGDPTGARPPTLGTPPSPPQTESQTPSAPTPRSPGAEKREPVKSDSDSGTRKAPQVTSFPELVQGEGDSKALLQE